ncbi:MAG: GH1 family beta-glucosidase [Bacillota bacterium]|nr:GH1 family beta-glucosidase [Bacillota bacterium]
MTPSLFPDGFLWGTATASYQIEGSPSADGKGESIWDRFSHTQGNIWNGDTGDVACDHYRRFEEDVKLMADLGLNAYRFSLSWPRIFPSGFGKPNEKGLDFYRRLVDQLHSRRIKPAITLYHWDLPQALQDRGGWNNRDTARYFADYATHMFNRLDLPVDLWITLNEPWVVAVLGNAFGIHAPGNNDFNLALQAAHNLLIGHGLAVKNFREADRGKEEIGITLSLQPVHPATDSEADLEAARISDGFMNRWFLDPLFKGSYPRDLFDIFSRLYTLPETVEKDAAIIAEPIDFLGINNYTRVIVQSSGVEDSFMGNPVNPPDSEYTDMGWEVYPRGLYELMTRIHREYGPLPLYITENGAAFPDEIGKDGTIGDQRRIDFLKKYLQECWNAIEEGVPLKGYFVWTLLDNFEWAYGYSKHFGIIHVDLETQKRTLKNSAMWYKDVISRNGLE